MYQQFDLANWSIQHTMTCRESGTEIIAMPALKIGVVSPKARVMDVEN